jgi:hypothetical protein
MTQDDFWPPPENWTQVFISWDRMLEQDPNCLEVTNWVEQYNGVGRYQLRGPPWNPTAGFLFYFEDPRDAEVFILKFI